MTYTTPQRVLLGLAIGDALGAATEFQSAVQAKSHMPTLEYRGGSPFGFAPGEATDDTQMTLAGMLRTMSHVGVVRDATRPLRLPFMYAERCHDAFHNWAVSHPPDIGGQTARACRQSLAQIRHDYESTVKAGREASAGNGGLMRAAAPFLAGLRGDALLSATVLHTAVTHYEPRCLTDAYALAHLLADSDNVASFHDAARRAHSFLLHRPETAEEILDALWLGFGGVKGKARDAMRLALIQAAKQTAQAINDGHAGHYAEPTGFTTSTLQNAVAHVTDALESDDPYGNAILAAAQNGGDADTIGCVTGALAAAYDENALTRPEHLPLVDGLRIGHQWPVWTDRHAPAAPRLLALVSREQVAL